MNFTTIKYTAPERAAQKTQGIGENQIVLANDLNVLLINVLNNLNTLLPNYADDAAAATGGIPVGGLYRSTSTIKVRIA